MEIIIFFSTLAGYLSRDAYGAQTVFWRRASITHCMYRNSCVRSQLFWSSHVFIYHIKEEWCIHLPLSRFQHQADATHSTPFDLASLYNLWSEGKEHIMGLTCFGEALVDFVAHDHAPHQFNMHMVHPQCCSSLLNSVVMLTLLACLGAISLVYF